MYGRLPATRGGEKPRTREGGRPLTRLGNARFERSMHRRAASAVDSVPTYIHKYTCTHTCVCMYTCISASRDCRGVHPGLLPSSGHLYNRRTRSARGHALPTILLIPHFRPDRIRSFRFLFFHHFFSSHLGFLENS